MTSQEHRQHESYQAPPSSVKLSPNITSTAAVTDPQGNSDKKDKERKKDESSGVSAQQKDGADEVDQKNRRREEEKQGKGDSDDKGEEEDDEVIKLTNLQKPIFDGSLHKKNDGTVSGALLCVDGEEPFLCTPLPITESNLLAWLMRDSSFSLSTSPTPSSNVTSNEAPRANRTINSGDDDDDDTNDNDNTAKHPTSSSTSISSPGSITGRRRKTSKYNNQYKNVNTYEKPLPESYIEGETLRYAAPEAKEFQKLKRDYHDRREFNRILASRIELGTATIDQDGRLVPIVDPDANADGDGDGDGDANVNPGAGVNMNNINGVNNDNDGIGNGFNVANRNDGGAVPGEGNNQQQEFGNRNRNGNNNNNFQHRHNNLDDDFFEENDDRMMLNNEEDQGFLPAVFGLHAQDWLDEEEQRRRNIERQEADAEEAIALVVNKYRSDGVPEDDFIFVSIPSRMHDVNNLTFRRIMIAVICVLAAFICIMMQTFNLIEDDVKEFDPKFDKLLYHLLNVRSFGTHILDCHGLHRDNEYIHSKSRGMTSTSTISALNRKRHRMVDCNDGVLHIPSISILSELDNKTATDEKLISSGLDQTYRPYRNGVNITWFHECALQDPPNSTCVLRREYPTLNDDEEESISKDDTCREDAPPPTACFRGVHDGMISDDEISQIFNLGKVMVSRGGDHMTIYEDVDPLYEILPSIPEKLENLLRSKYAIPKVKPVAFRVGIAFPIATSSSQNTKGTHETSIIEARNETVYKNWYNQVQRINSWPKLAIPIPTPYRDQCLLVSDLEASANFAFHTSIFLSDGAGEQFSGGVSLFVDNHQSNTNPRKKVQRGVTVDGSRGRIVVNSGGEDNLRCRLPMRGGARAELNIWWNCID